MNEKERGDLEIQSFSRKFLSEGKVLYKADKPARF